MRTKFIKSGQKGFSLVELMVVVAIIGVLAALAVPKFQVFQAKAKQSEAKNNLSHIYTLQESYFGDNDAYGTTAQIGFVPQGKLRYGYVSTTGATFTATATATVQIAAGCAGDRWTINNLKVLANPVNCAK